MHVLATLTILESALQSYPHHSVRFTQETKWSKFEFLRKQGWFSFSQNFCLEIPDFDLTCQKDFMVFPFERKICILIG